MKVRDLRVALEEIEKTVSVAGTKSAKTDVQGILELIQEAENDNQSLDVFLADLEDRLQRTKSRQNTVKEVTVNHKLVANYHQKLETAGNDEGRFLQVVAKIENDKNVLKGEMIAIASLYSNSDEKTKTRALEAIKTEYYARQYEITTSEMAKRATPW